MKDHEIGQIAFDEIEKTISIITLGGNQLKIRFKRDMYFDFVCGLARRQNAQTILWDDEESFSVVFDELITELNRKLNSLTGSRQKEYAYNKKILQRDSWSRTWAQDFTQHRRKYVEEVSKSSVLYEKDVKIILGNLFRYKGSGKTTIFWLGTKKIFLPKSFHLLPYVITSLTTPLGRQQLPCVQLAVDVEQGFGPEDIQVTIREDRISIPSELDEERQGLFRERKLALMRGERYPWPGTTYGIDDFFEITRPSITEKNKVHIILRPTDYFTFKAVQNCLDKYIFRYGDRSSQTLRDKYLTPLIPHIIVPLCAQAVSATVSLICKDDDVKEWILLAERSSSKMLATGQDFFVLSANETPKRKPTPEELKLLENVPPEKIEPDPIGPGGPFFHAAVRGAKEELGINLPIETIKFFCFNMEPKRYQFAFVGIADTNLEKSYVTTCLSKAKDRKLEYKAFYWIPFTPESVYNFMVTNAPWGSEAEIGLYFALSYKFKHDPDRVDRLFKDYNKPLPHAPADYAVEKISLE